MKKDNLLTKEEIFLTTQSILLSIDKLTATKSDILFFGGNPAEIDKKINQYQTIINKLSKEA